MATNFELEWESWGSQKRTHAVGIFSSHFRSLNCFYFCIYFCDFWSLYGCFRCYRFIKCVFTSTCQGFHISTMTRGCEFLKTRCTHPPIHDLPTSLFQPCAFLRLPGAIFDYIHSIMITTSLQTEKTQDTCRNSEDDTRDHQHRLAISIPAYIPLQSFPSSTKPCPPMGYY